MQAGRKPYVFVTLKGPDDGLPYEQIVEEWIEGMRTPEDLCIHHRSQKLRAHERSIGHECFRFVEQGFDLHSCQHPWDQGEAVTVKLLHEYLR